jgi:DNA-binding MarR family transcriptional regulator
MKPAAGDPVELPPSAPLGDEGRAAGEAARVQLLEEREPLRARILDQLAEKPATPTELARRLHVHKESISRILKVLREEALVEIRLVPGDRRRRRYVLTPAGSVELSRHHAYGEAPPPVEKPSSAETLAFLRSALEASVQMRRTGNSLNEAAERQRRILREAQKEGQGHLVVEVMHELATTLRQAREESMVEELVAGLDKIALGRAEYKDPELPLQAAAHRAYALGRLREGEDVELAARLNHLIVAAGNYRDLAKGSSPLPSIRWRERQAWSMISLAANLRAGSRVEDALRVANGALDLFEEIEDPYGRSHTLFLIGFCLRLLADYDSAWFWLSEANALAEEHSFERFQADSLLQIGEVLRFRGDLENAGSALLESRERAMRMGLKVIQAYSHSALGALAFQRGELRDAQLELNRAQEQFSGIINREGLVLRANEGLALNERRLATVTRLLSKQGETVREREAAHRAAERHALAAEEYYYARRKPAGVVASKIEQDRLRMDEDREPVMVAELLDLLEGQERERERRCLELDPWVPRLLNIYSGESQSAPLKERSLQLLEKARRRLGEEVQRVMTRQPVTRPATEAHHQDQADEMGGEAREIIDEAEVPVVV